MPRLQSCAAYRSCCAYGPEVGHAGRQPASANCVQTMWLAEHGLHSDSGYLPKELMGQRDRLSDKDFNDTIIQRFTYDVIQSPPPTVQNTKT